MDPQQRSSFRQITHDDRERGFDPSGAVRHIALEPDGIEHPPLGRHAGGGSPPERLYLDDACHVCLRLSRPYLCPRYSAAGMKLFDLGGVEPELFENFVVVLA